MDFAKYIVARESDLEIKYKLSHTAFEILTDNGKPSERVGRKADRPKFVIGRWSLVIR